jgi:hypothetical protein
MKKILALLVLLPLSALAQSVTVNLSASVTSGLAPLTTVLTWTSTGATTCVGSNGWTGTKTLSGTQTMTGLLASKTYVLTCSAASGTANATWVAPTQNTDGTPLTNLAGYKLYYANSTAGVPTATPIVINDKLATAYSISGLAAGSWYFGAKAFNTSGTDSDMSAVATKTIVTPSAVATQIITIETKPMPPVVTVSQLAYDIRKNWYGKTVLGRVVGNVDLGVQCGEKVINKYFSIPRDVVDLTRVPRSYRIVARCA